MIRTRSPQAAVASSHSLMTVVDRAVVADCCAMVAVEADEEQSCQLEGSDNREDHELDHKAPESGRL